MIREVGDCSRETLAGFDQIIDVRSPAEFAEDHVPGAVNLPVLNDEERARVGTLFVQDDPFRARRIGAALVARNVARHLEGELAGRGGGWRPLVYCWRGGQRSNAFATVLSQVGWRTAVLDGGYRTYRRSIVAALYDFGDVPPLVVLSGETGVGKTEIIAQLVQDGAQVLDLEALASHRGSLFGGLAHRPQPSQKLFESRVQTALAACDPARPVIVEAESSKLGEIVLPPRLWAAMTRAVSIEVAAEVPARIRRLVRLYGDLADDERTFADAITRLPRHIGGQQRDRWRALLGAGEFEALARELLLIHYDPAYRRSAQRTPRPLLGVVTTGDGSPETLRSAAARVHALVSANFQAEWLRQRGP